MAFSVWFPARSNGTEIIRQFQLHRCLHFYPVRRAKLPDWKIMACGFAACRNFHNELRPPLCRSDAEPEFLAEDACPHGRDGDGADIVQPPCPALVQAVCADRRIDRSGEMQSLFTPIEAASTQHATRSLCPRREYRLDIDPDPAQKRHAGLRQVACISGQLDIPEYEQGVSQGDTQLAGKLIAGSP